MSLRHLIALVSVTGWRRPIGSPKLQIIFHKRATKYRSLLRKMTYKDKGLLNAPPFQTKGGAFEKKKEIIFTSNMFGRQAGPSVGCRKTHI